MAEDKLNAEVPTTFATPVAEKTELERLQERIANFKVSITPQVAQLAQVLMNQSLQQPTKAEDLDGYVAVRNELKTGLDEYQQQLQSAQTRMSQLQVQHEQEKQMELARREEDLKAARDGERKRRKTAEEKARQLEAVLASHGIHIDLDGDGKVGLNVGEEQENLTAEQQVTLKKLLDESKAATTSRAFEKAREMNPVPQSESHGEIPNPPPVQFELEVPEVPKGTDEFLEEVDRVFTEDEELADKIAQTKKSFEEFKEEVGYDANGSPTAEVDGDNMPKISDTNSPEIIEKELEKVRVVPEDNITEVEESFESPADTLQVSTEEEYDEVVIPTESELKAMTKSKILREAKNLGFTNVSTKDTKSDMIANFISSSEEFIQGLQDTGEFVSATSTDEDTNESTDSEDVRDGGYFK